MPLKAIRTKIKAKDVALAVTSVAAVVADVADMASFPPVRAAATILLVILQTIQEIESNKDSCHRLARRAARLLMDIKQRMDGRWDTAPKALVDNILQFETVLSTIKEFMQELAKTKWMGRLLQKSSIEESLNSFHDKLDEAERSFQISSLIEIHYTVGMLQRQNDSGSQSTQLLMREPDCEAKEPGIPSPPPTYDAAVLTAEAPATRPQSTLNSASADAVSHSEALPPDAALSSRDQELQVSVRHLKTGDCTTFENSKSIDEEILELDTYGFKRHHQSEVRLRAPLRGVTSASFWSNSSTCDVEGQRFIVKRYDADRSGRNEARKRWIHDIKKLKDLFHPNLPQLVGFSDDKSPTPFIVLADVKLRDPNAYLMKFLESKSIVDCAALMLKMYRDVSSAVLYVQQQQGLDQNEAQNFVSDASYSLNADGNVIVGLPPSKTENSVTFYRYGFTESLLKNVMSRLPKEEHFLSLKGTSEADKVIELRNKYIHVRALAFNLLPKEDEPPELVDALNEFLDDEDFGSGYSLARLRELKINTGGHDHAWQEGVHACNVKFEVGDVGYISKENADLLDKARFNNFVKLGNVLESIGLGAPTCGGSRGDQGSARTVPHATNISVVRESTGSQTQWVNGFIDRQDVWPFVLPGDMEGWPLSLSPQDEISITVHHSARMASVNEAWRFLMHEARAIAKAANLEPHEVILITRSIRGLRYTVKHFGFVPHFHQTPQIHSPHNRFGAAQQHFGRPALPGAHFNNPFFGPPPPQMVYLFTSPRVDFEPFWSSRPSAASAPPDKRGGLPRDIIPRGDWPEAYIDYIQLSNEDFVEATSR